MEGMSIIKRRSAVTAVIGFVLVGLGFGAFFGVPSLITRIVNQRLLLRPNAQATRLWKDIPVPIFETFYLFNVTNPEEIERFGARPILNEIGPFTYRLSLNKTLTFNGNGTVSFREKKTWHFDLSRSITDEHQILTTLNGPLALTLTLLQNASPAVRTIVELALAAITEGFFIKRSVKQLLFEGYPDILTTFAPLLNPEITTYTNGRFAWLVGKNATDDGLYTVFTGERTMEEYSLIERYENKSSLPYWLTAECNSFSDTGNGELRPPLGVNKTSVKLFIPDLCRALLLEYNKTYVPPQTEGVKAHRFILSEHTFKNATDYPANACYDTKLRKPAPPAPAAERVQSRLRNLLDTFQRRSSARSGSPVSAALVGEPLTFPSGVFDISKCKYGVPIVISLPHFLHGDESYRKAVGGMKPNESKHSFWMDVEPATGSTIRIEARIQVNVAINKGPGGYRYRNIPNVVFPVLWQELRFEMTDAVADQLWLAQNMPNIMGAATSYSLFTIGSLVTMAALLIPVYHLYRATKSKVKNSNKPESQDDNRNILNRQSSTASDIGIDNPVSIQA